MKLWTLIIISGLKKMGISPSLPPSEMSTADIIISSLGNIIGHLRFTDWHFDYPQETTLVTHRMCQVHGLLTLCPSPLWFYPRHNKLNPQSKSLMIKTSIYSYYKKIIIASVSEAL